MQQNLQIPGDDISPRAEVVHLSSFGFWINANNQEFYLPFSKFPWFQKATVDQICNIVVERPGHFHWPELDIDLDKDRIEYPERYPLVQTGL